MRIMYRYLTTNLFPAYMENEFQGVQTSPAHSSALAHTSGNPHYGKLVTPLIFHWLLDTELTEFHMIKMP